LAERLGVLHFPRRTDGFSPNLERTHIDNPHVEGMLLGQVVKDNVLRVTDLYSPAATPSRMSEIPRSQKWLGGLASPGLPWPAVTAAAASNPISTRSQRSKRLQAFRNLAPATVGALSFYIEPDIIPPSFRRPTGSLCEEET